MRNSLEYKTSLLFLKKNSNTGALCCVAAGPHEAKPNGGGRDHSMDHGEPHWQTNYSFSPPPLRISDYRLQSDGLPHQSGEVPSRGSSISSNSKGIRSRIGSDRYTNHYHSLSDGVLSFSGSPPDNFQAPRWTSPAQQFNVSKFATTSMGGSSSGTPLFPHSTEGRYTGRISVTSHNSGSPSALSESGHWRSTSKKSFSFSNHRRSFMSKPVYPLTFHNPVPDCETFGGAGTSRIRRLTTPSEAQISPYWLDNSSIPDPSTSSRRDGFGWSSASSYDLGFEGESSSITDHLEMESLRSPKGDKKCGVCGKFLFQKSPWSSQRIMRGRDMPTAGVLPCSHVFHAECLEQMTPKAYIHDPPCPLCVKVAGTVDDLPLVSEASRSIGRSSRVVIKNFPDDKEASGHVKNKSGSLMKNHLKKHFTFKGKLNKDLFSTKVFRKSGSASSSREPVCRNLFIR